MMDIKTFKNNLKDHTPFITKFADIPFDTTHNNQLMPGVAEPSYDKFFTRMVEQPVLLNQSTIVPMTSIMHDLDMLDVDVELETQRDATTQQSTGLTNVETSPDRERKQLLAVPLQAKTLITDNFLNENIEKEGFMSTYMNMLADNMGPAFEKFGIYAVKGSTTVEGEGSGYKMADGILQQLKNISADSSSNAGYSKLIYSNKVTEGLINAAQTYIDQDGDIVGANFVLPPEMYGRFVSEIAVDRETQFGDAVFVDGNITKVLGIPVVQDNILRKVRNGFNEEKFTNDELKGNGTKVTNMKYGFLGKASNLVFGMLRDFEVKNQWSIDALGTKVAMLCSGDAKVLYDQDTIALPFTLNKSA